METIRVKMIWMITTNDLLIIFGSSPETNLSIRAQIIGLRAFLRVVGTGRFRPATCLLIL
jgi:hypothetical protein